jgi:enamine deaminase RidA (YjgF/YER057c/UK114 family)
MTAIEQRLQSLGIIIPTPAAPVANYVGWTRTGSLLFTAGQLPLVAGKLHHTGLVGDAINTETAQAEARICAINVIAQLKSACDGDLERIRRIVKITGFVASAPGYFDQPKVVNGASDFLVEIFGERGKHARSAVGVASLPLNACVEIEAIAEIN